MRTSQQDAAAWRRTLVTASCDAQGTGFDSGGELQTTGWRNDTHLRRVACRHRFLDRSDQPAIVEDWRSEVVRDVPGPLPRKAVAVANVAAVLAPTGVLFGASILGPSGPHTWLSRKMLHANNRRGIFDNLGDTEEGLGEILGHRSST